MQAPYSSESIRSPESTSKRLTHDAHMRRLHQNDDLHENRQISHAPSADSSTYGAGTSGRLSHTYSGALDETAFSLKSATVIWLLRFNSRRS